MTQTVWKLRFRFVLLTNNYELLVLNIHELKTTYEN